MLLAFACSCNTSSGVMDSKDIINIDPNTASKVRVNYSSWFDGISYIPLQTDSNFLVGKVDKLLVTDDYIFIMDRKISRSVFCMDKEGHKVFSLNKSGKGRGEYVSMNDIAFDAAKKELIIHCDIRKKLLYYNMHGAFLREESVPYEASRTQPVGDHLALYCGFDDNSNLKESGKFANLALIGADKQTVESAAEYFEAPVLKTVVWTSECQFSQVNDTLLSIKPDHCNTVYHVTPTTIYPAYTLDFGDYMVDGRYWEKTKEKNATSKKLDAYSNNLKLCESFRYFEGNDYIFFVYRQAGVVYNALYSKKTKRLLHTPTFQNDMDMVSLFRPVAVYRDKFYCVLEAGDVYRIKKYPVNTSIPNEIMDHVQEFDNPILAVFTLKPF